MILYALICFIFLEYCNIQKTTGVCVCVRLPIARALRFIGPSMYITRLGVRVISRGKVALYGDF